MKDPLRDAELWLSEARTDLAVARRIAEEFPARACFHAQQGAEKALKAILYAAGERPVLGHSLAELGPRVTGHSVGYAEIESEVRKLDRFYIPTLYPNGLPEGGLPSAAYDAGDAREAIALAEQAIGHAATFLEEQGRG